jgi:hypothetical protein
VRDEAARSREARASAEAALVRVVHHYGSKPEFVVLGGLVPQLLCSTSDYEHAGRTGDPNGWSEDEAELAPLAMTKEVAVTLCCGAAGELPDFRVRVVCRAGDETCELPVALPDPRTGAVLQ